ncbi:MAG: hypothetical protein RMJ89_12565, partial [Flammeovirgaceae bacterium]|nr:hypothetical protein [Flammeovirgaceae bacterium]
MKNIRLFPFTIVRHKSVEQLELQIIRLQQQFRETENFLKKLSENIAHDANTVVAKDNPLY